MQDDDNIARTTSLTHSPVSTGWKPRACSVQAGDGHVSLTERHGSILSGWRPPTVVWHAIQPTSAVITDPSAGRPPVAVCNCWRPSLRHCWCSVVEQLASRHCCVWHFLSSAENLQHFCLGSLIHLFCFSFFLCGPCGFYLGYVKNL